MCLQVLRWSALGFGVFYGAYHQLSLSAADRAKAAQKDWEHKESLIRQAKEQWARDHPSEQPKSSGGTSVVRHELPKISQSDQDTCVLTSAIAKADPKDPNADLHALLGITDK